MRKPTWMKAADFTVMMQRCGGIPCCAVTGETDDLSIDHIVPTYDGGTDDVSNLQFLKKALNFRKGIRPDKYWSQHFYFDQTPHQPACRAAQQGIYQEILAQADWFGEPASNIARLLYLFPMVVGSGKTLAILMAACAYNAVVRARWGAARRADRVLVLTKERAIRDQLALDLTRDPIRYGILPIPARAVVVKHGWQLDNEALLLNHDIVFSCIQQLWDGERDLCRLFDRFPVIFIDEPHFAADQVMSIVEHAKTSICFGGTGTPIDGSGELLKRMINVFSFGYEDAREKDRSVKFLSSDWRQFIHISALDQATMLDDTGKVSTRTDTETMGYGKNFEPAKSVAWEVILHMQRCDGIDAEYAKKAPHREDYPCEVSVFYPLHALIGCDNVRFANHLARTINDLFDKDRKRFPRERGWQAEVVHAEGEEPDGRKRPDKPLLPGHAWLRAKDQPGYRLDRHCSRILLVVGMGREGVNNPLCGVFGITTDHASVVEGVQRILGRQVRGVTVTKEDGTLCVPPAELDTVTIITHPAFEDILGVLQESIEFVVDMDKKLEGLPTILDLQAEKDINALAPGRDELPLSFAEKIQIAGVIGSNSEVEDDAIIEVFGKGNPRAERRIIDWIETVRERPQDACHQLKFDAPLLTFPTVLAETMTRNPSDDQLQAFFRAKMPDLAQRSITDDNREFARAIFCKDADEVQAATPVLFNPDGSQRNIDQVRMNMAGSIQRDLGHHFVRDKDSERSLYSLVGRAVKVKLGVPDAQPAAVGSQWDIPPCLMMIERADVQREIRSWVIGRLIEMGYCPSLAALHGGVSTAAAE